METLSLGTSILNLEGNKIGEIGCKGLSRGDWPSLEQINLGRKCVDKGKNKLGEKGLAYLSKAEWREVIEIFIGNLRIIKVLLLLDIGAADG